MKKTDPIPSVIEDTVKAILANDLNSAKKYIKTIHEKELYFEREALLKKTQNKRKKHSNITKTQRSGHDSYKKVVFETNNYTCCYCNRKTIDLEVLKVISRVIPDVFPYHKNWKFSETHILYWVYSTSLEHVIPLALGGKNDSSNMRASCYLCNDAKSDIKLEDLGWELSPNIDNENHWRGLTEYLPLLKKISHSEIPQKECSKLQSSNSFQRLPSSNYDISELSVGNFIRTCLPGKKSRRQYRVDDLKDETIKMITLTEMWMENETKQWVASKNRVTVMVENLSGTELIFEIAPSEGLKV